MSDSSTSRSGLLSAITPRMILVVVLAALALTFVFQNTKQGTVTFLFWHVEAPAWTWLVVMFAAGVIVGSLFPWFGRRGARH